MIQSDSELQTSTNDKVIISNPANSDIIVIERTTKPHNMANQLSQCRPAPLPGRSKEPIKRHENRQVMTNNQSEISI